MSNKRKRAVRARKHARHHMTNRPDAQDVDADPKLVAGLVEVPFMGHQARRPLAQALKTLNFPITKIAADKLMSSPEGGAAAEVLIAATRVMHSTLPTIARRFKKHPETMAAFSAAWRLDADRTTLQQILHPIWKESRNADG